MALKANKKAYKERQRKKNRRHTELRRLAYQFVRENLPDVWEELRIEVGMKPLLKKKK
jgi:hypothetical protein